MRPRSSLVAFALLSRLGSLNLAITYICSGSGSLKKDSLHKILNIYIYISFEKNNTNISIHFYKESYSFVTPKTHPILLIVDTFAQAVVSAFLSEKRGTRNLRTGNSSRGK